MNTRIFIAFIMTMMIGSNDIKGIDTIVGRTKVPLLVVDRHERVGKGAG
jgi:hypothetical protein